MHKLFYVTITGTLAFTLTPTLILSIMFKIYLLDCLVPFFKYVEFKIFYHVMH
jgi:hypothetical protein